MPAATSSTTRPTGMGIELSGPRTSKLAVVAIVLSAGLCIPGAGVPGPGVIAAVLGIVALLRIGHSRGMLRGRGIAAIAILLGILQTMIAIGLWIGAASTIERISRTYGPAMTAVESGDTTALTDLLAADYPLANLATDVQRLRDGYTPNRGAFEGMATGLGGVFEGFNTIGWREGRGDPGLIRLPGRFGMGYAGVRFELDPAGSLMSSGARRIANVGVELPDGSIVWLRAGSGP